MYITLTNALWDEYVSCEQYGNLFPGVSCEQYGNLFPGVWFEQYVNLFLVMYLALVNELWNGCV